MRVLALVTDAFGGSGGIAAYNRQILAALAAGGARVEVRARRGRPGTLPAGVVQGPPRPGRADFTAALARRLARGPRPELVWCGHIHLAPLAALAARATGAALWLQAHGIEAWTRPGRAVRAAVERAGLVTAVSRVTRSRLLAWSTLPPERVRVLPNAVAPDFAPGPKPAPLLARHGLEGRRVLFTLARLAAAEGYKGHDRVIGLLPALAARLPDLAYVIGGDGDDRPRLEGLAAALGVAERCRFIGPVPEGETAAHHRMADVFVMPSTGEGFGIVYLEAMACGVPAVGLDGDGSVDPLGACPLGHAVPEAALGETLAGLLSHPPGRPRAVPEGLAPFAAPVVADRARALADAAVAR